MDEPIIEVTVYARRYSGAWYPVGSDTPIPTVALVEAAPPEDDVEPVVHYV